MIKQCELGKCGMVEIRSGICEVADQNWCEGCSYSELTLGDAERDERTKMFLKGVKK